MKDNSLQKETTGYKQSLAKGTLREPPSDPEEGHTIEGAVHQKRVNWQNVAAHFRKRVFPTEYDKGELWSVDGQ